MASLNLRLNESYLFQVVSSHQKPNTSKAIIPYPKYWQRLDDWHKGDYDLHEKLKNMKRSGSLSYVI
jgi:hypothetical protein